jgi:ATPase family associated with various cellular activities (AAA)
MEYSMSAETASLPGHSTFFSQIVVSVYSIEAAMLSHLLFQAQNQNDRTFTVFREADAILNMKPGLLLDQLALRSEWQSLRADSSTLIIRAQGFFGIVETLSGSEYFTLRMRLWANTNERVERIRSTIFELIEHSRVTITGFRLNWRFMSGKGEINSVITEESATDVLLDEAYPGLGDSVDNVIRRYLDAPESILLLQGPPGTGKTRLIRGVLREMSRRKGQSAEVMFTGDKDVLDSDETFIDFAIGRHDAFLLEDADHLLLSRTGGNPTLHRMLNIADGIIRAKGQKIIFSTNLVQARDIDEALIRPGRCFAHTMLRPLRDQEPQRLLRRLCETDNEHLARASAALASTTNPTVAQVYSAHRRTAHPDSNDTVHPLLSCPSRSFGLVFDGGVPR